MASNFQVNIYLQWIHKKGWKFFYTKKLRGSLKGFLQEGLDIFP